jgi:hypothetical protein
MNGSPQTPLRRALLFMCALTVMTALVLVLTVPATADVPSDWVIDGRAPVWVDDFDGRGSGHEHADDVAVSPDGTEVFVTGGSSWTGRGFGWVTMAFSSDGQLLWSRKLGHPGGLTGEIARSIATGPGGRVFVTGEAIDADQRERAVTVAYDAETGERLWVRQYPKRGLAAGNDYVYPTAVALGPSGRRVFVAGTRYVELPDEPWMGTRYVVWAYRAWNGEPIWVRVVDRGRDSQTVNGMSLDPTGRFVLATGESDSGFGTLAVDSRDGSVAWFRRYDVRGFQNGIAVTGSATRAFVTGYDGVGTATVAYDLANGTERWVSRFGFETTSDGAQPEAIAVSPDGRTVAITGFWDDGTTGDQDFATVAYAARSGVARWTFTDPVAGGSAGGGAVTIPASGNRVIATGYGRPGGIVTFAYAIPHGSVLWWGTAKDREAGSDSGSAIASDPTGTRVYLVGTTSGGPDGQDFATLAYAA